MVRGGGVDRYAVLVVYRKNGELVNKFGPYEGDEGAETAHKLAQGWTDPYLKAVVVGL